MSANNIIKDYGWVGLGSLCGLLAGSVSNLLQTKSIIKRPEKPIGFGSPEYCKRNKINTFRERGMMGGLTPGFNAMALVPVAGCVAWNILAGGFRNLPTRICSETYSHLISPVLTTVSSLLIGKGIRSIWEKNFPKSSGLDISGHAIVQTACTIQMMHTLKSFADHGHSIQQAAIGSLVGAFSITDAVFMYNTVAYTHSIADVVAGIALPILGYLGVQTTAQAIESVSSIIFGK